MMPVLIVGLVTSIAAYHYIRIFKYSRDDACSHLGLVMFIAAYHYIRTFNYWVDDARSHLWPHDVHRSLSLHLDLQFLGG